ncbi:MAG TPA: class I SAM-dependent methyltransferase [Burkholderiales bacterium]|nr:class I SAM-dependent methyltransferase [Burkholderiales bacterium]
MRALGLSEALYAYVARRGARETAVQKALRVETGKLRFRGMQIGPDQGALLALLVRLLRARRCLEIGTFTGASALAVALALPPRGRVVCCDTSEEWTAIARRYWAKAGVASRIKLRLGPALDTLRSLRGPFDFAFIDADKSNYRAYYERCLALVRRGGLIAIDNTLWGGAVIDAARRDADTRAIRALNAALVRDRRVDLALLTVGDGLTLALKR